MKIYIKTIGICVLTIFILTIGALADDSLKTKISKVEIKEHKYRNMYGSASYLITSSKGTTILTDPINLPTEFKADIITVSHDHPDHVNYVFLDLMQDSKQSLYKIEEISYADVSVKSIPSSHSPSMIDKNAPNNVIYIFEVDGYKHKLKNIKIEKNKIIYSLKYTKKNKNLKEVSL